MIFPLPNADQRLDSQVAIVTGASSGLGWRFARVLAAAGATVAVTARRRDRLDTLVAEIETAGGRAMAFPLDCADAAACEAIVDTVAAALGPVSILVNNAGIPDAQRAVKIEIPLYDQVVNVNQRAPWLISCALARHLIAAKRPGRIVNIASIAAYEYGGGGAALYSVTKAAVVRMTEALAVEWARFHINVNAIAPGAFASEMMDGMLARIGDFTHAFPRQRLGLPEQMDSTLLYLVAPASECVTGTIIKIDDGQNRR
jgi:NAD(P)-dependent dehydrogenase (short-subunit alcohol dehydrogenase family)